MPVTRKPVATPQPGTMANVNRTPILPPCSIYPVSPNPDLSFLNSASEGDSNSPSPFLVSLPLSVVQPRGSAFVPTIPTGAATGDQMEGGEDPNREREVQLARIRSVLSEVLGLRRENAELKEKLRSVEGGENSGKERPTADHEIQTDHVLVLQSGSPLERLTRTVSAWESAHYEMLENLGTISESLTMLLTGQCNIRLALENFAKEMEDWRNGILMTLEDGTVAQEGSQAEEGDGIQTVTHFADVGVNTTDSEPVTVTNDPDRSSVPLDGGSGSGQPSQEALSNDLAITSEQGSSTSEELPGSRRVKRAAAEAAMEFIDQIRAHEAKQDEYINSIQLQTGRTDSAKKKKVE